MVDTTVHHNNKRAREVCAGVQAGKIPRRGIRVAVLLFSREDRGAVYILRMEYKLAREGHVVIHAQASLMDIGMDLARMTAET